MMRSRFNGSDMHCICLMHHLIDADSHLIGIFHLFHPKLFFPSISLGSFLEAQPQQNKKNNEGEDNHCSVKRLIKIIVISLIVSVVGIL